MDIKTFSVTDLHLSGYDGFGQLSGSSERINLGPQEAVVEVVFAWSNCLLFCKNDGKEAGTYLAGLLDQKKTQLEKLELPEKDDKIIDGTINSRYILVLTENRKVWRFTLLTKKWNDITSIMFVEHNESALNSDEQQIEILKIVGNEGMNIVLLSDGSILNVPNVISKDALRLEIVEVAVGLDHAVFLSNGGLVFTYGSGGRGQLGHGELENEDDLREVRALSGIQISEVAAAGWHSVARSYCGDLYGWGWNNWGQLSVLSTEEHLTSNFKGTVISEPTLMNWPNDDVNVLQVACGNRHTIALLDDGSVWGCGWNGHDQLPGLNFNKSAVYPLMSQLRLPNNRKVKKIACGVWNSAFWFS